MRESVEIRTPVSTCQPSAPCVVISIYDSYEDSPGSAKVSRVLALRTDVVVEYGHYSWGADRRVPVTEKELLEYNWFPIYRYIQTVPITAGSDEAMLEEEYSDTGISNELSVRVVDLSDMASELIRLCEKHEISLAEVDYHGVPDEYRPKVCAVGGASPDA